MAEPILWAHRAESTRKIPARRWNPQTARMEEAFDEETGERLFEKIPQRAHEGGDADNPIVGKPRWMHVLRHDGHVVRHKLTCAAADLDVASTWAQERRAKARFLGWIPVGHCPLAMLLTGDIRKGQILAKEIIKDDPCQHGTYSEMKHCPHYTAEEAARKALRAKKQAIADQKTRSDADKLVEASHEQTKEIVSGVASVLADAIKGAKGSSK